MANAPTMAAPLIFMSQPTKVAASLAPLCIGNVVLTTPISTSILKGSTPDSACSFTNASNASISLLVIKPLPARALATRSLYSLNESTICSGNQQYSRLYAATSPTKLPPQTPSQPPHSSKLYSAPQNDIISPLGSVAFTASFCT